MPEGKSGFVNWPPPWVLEQQRKREAVRAEFGQFFDDLVALFYRCDPMGLAAIEAPADEYAPEVGTVLPRLHSADGVEQVRTILQAEFLTWFDSEPTPAALDRLAGELWSAWAAHRAMRQ